MVVDKDNILVAQAVSASDWLKNQAEDAAAWEHDIVLWNDLMMRLIIIQSAGDAKEEEVKKISHDLHLLEKRLENKAFMSGDAQRVEGCHASAQCVPRKSTQDDVAPTTSSMTMIQAKRGNAQAIEMCP